MTAKIATLRAALQGVGPGLLVSAVIAAAAGVLATSTHGPAMLFALLIGLSANFFDRLESWKKGVDFTSKFVLRLGVALLGLKITAGDVASLGWPPLLLVFAAVSLTIALSTITARWMGFDARFGLLSGGATAICGASAAMAISAALPNHPRKEHATAFTVVGVSILSTAAMLLYPAITRLTGMDNQHAGIFIGASIHDVAQVVGAGMVISPEAGNTATIVKLARVAMLLPVIVVVGITTRCADTPSHQRPPLLPWFAVAFAVLVFVNSVLPLPALVTGTGNTASRYFLMCAIAAIGLKTRVADILAVGWRPVILMVMETVLIAGIALLPVALQWV